jgi:hypothetical protein
MNSIQYQVVIAILALALGANQLGLIGIICMVLATVCIIPYVANLITSLFAVTHTMQHNSRQYE